MQDKTNPFPPPEQTLIHNIPAGIRQDDQTTELFACRQTRKVFAVSQGHTIHFKDIPEAMRAQIFAMMLSDEVAMADLRDLGQEEALEEYTHCVFGALDHIADFCVKGQIRETDNFLCSGSCRCIHWKTKKISVDGKALTPRKIQIVQLLATDTPDKQIADVLGISLSTLDTHKTQIFELFNVGSKHGMIRKAIEQKIVQ